MIYRHTFCVGLVFLCLHSNTTGAQELQTISSPSSCKDGSLSPKIFENRPYFEPLPASLLEAQSAVFFGLSNPFPYAVNGGKHRTMRPSLGFEMPIAVWDGFKVDEQEEYNNKRDRDIPIGNECWGFGLWLAPGFHTALDFNENGQPIIDIDFRVALMVKLAYGISDRERLGMRFGVCHESSHMTIDYSRNAINAFPSKFKDVDVNYECYEVSGNLDRDYSWGTISMRGGSMFSMNREHDGFYSANGVTLMSSKRNYEPYVGLQYTPRKTRGWGLYVSATGYALPTYNYDRKSPDEPEAIRISTTAVLGLRDFSKGRGVPDFVLRCYSGRNPYGPLRFQNTWKTCDAGITLR